MQRVLEIGKSLVLLLGCYVLFGILGQYTALGLLSVVPVTVVGGWFIYAASLATAVGTLAWTTWWYRSGRTLQPSARIGLAGFVAFFCWQWTLAGVPDWNPIPLLAATVVCWGASLALLRTSRLARAF